MVNMPSVWEMVAGLIVSFAIVVVLMPVVIPYLRKLKFGQQIIEEYGPTWHKNKQGVPTMGGMVFILAAVIGFVFFGFKYYSEASFLSSKGFACLITSCLLGLVGFLDDFIKIKKKHNLGLTESQKLILQVIIAVAFVAFMALNRDFGTFVFLPSFNGSGETLCVDIGFFAYILWFLAIIGFTNAVNFTDGIDGLATGVTIPVLIFFVFVANITYNAELSVLSMIVIGACIGFLVFNWHPAKIFMGDTGSMFLGGIVTTVAISLDMTIVLLVAGTLFGGKMSFAFDFSSLIMVYICIASIFSYCIWFTVVKSGELSKLFIIKFAEPVFAAVFGALLLGENIFRPQYAISFLLIATGIYISNK